MRTDDDRDTTTRLRAELRRLRDAATSGDRPVHLTDAYGELLLFLVERVDGFGVNLVQCTYCGRDDMPVSKTVGRLVDGELGIPVRGPKTQYACPICYADNAIENGVATDDEEMLR